MEYKKNAYLFFKENQMYKFLYIKLQPIEMAKALPISYKENSGCYLSAIFDPDGRDFLGQSNDYVLLLNNRFLFHNFFRFLHI